MRAIYNYNTCRFSSGNVIGKNDEIKEFRQ